MGIKKLSIILLIIVSLITLFHSFPVYAASDFTFNGFGSGHGVGMCMAGAEEMARQGYTYRDILRKYYSRIVFSEIAEPQTIKVGLYSSINSFSISANGSFFAYENDPNGAKYIGEGLSGQAFKVSYSNEGTLTYTITRPDASIVTASYSIRFVPVSGSSLILTENGFNYSGVIEAKYSANSAKLWAINEVNLNEYLYGIAEEPDSWPPEAIKALAVAARTYVMEKKLNPTSRHKADGFDVCSTSDCQCYVGIRSAPNLKAAVDATTGVILTHPKAPYGAIITAYHSCCGGYTENNENVWGGSALAFLRGVPCGFCNWSPNFNWSVTFPDYELENKLKSSSLTTPLGNILGLEILSRGVSGRVTSLRIIGSEGDKNLDLNGVNTFKTLLGLKSTFFNFRPSKRLFGQNRYSTAAAISKEGWTSSTTVILASGENFPDTLAGAPLAYKNNCPLLLTKATFLTSETEAEISRLGAIKVIILGGEGAVSKEVEDALKAKGLTIQRIGGKNRYETAAFIAKELGSPGSTAILVTGENFPDALAISPYAAYNKIPVLLTRKDVLPEETKKVIGELGITNVIVVGGSGVVSSSALLSLPSYVRVGGTDRYDTARLIAERYFRSVYASENVFIATGENFPDALSGAPLAASKGSSPILLVKKTGVPSPTRDYVMGYSSSIKYAYILGGTGAVSEAVKQAIEGM